MLQQSSVRKSFRQILPNDFVIRHLYKHRRMAINQLRGVCRGNSCGLITPASVSSGMTSEVESTLMFSGRVGASGSDATNTISKVSERTWSSFIFKRECRACSTNERSAHGETPRKSQQNRKDERKKQSEEREILVIGGFWQGALTLVIVPNEHCQLLPLCSERRYSDRGEGERAVRKL